MVEKNCLTQISSNKNVENQARNTYKTFLRHQKMYFNR